MSAMHQIEIQSSLSFSFSHRRGGSKGGGRWVRTTPTRRFKVFHHTHTAETASTVENSSITMHLVAYKYKCVYFCGLCHCSAKFGSNRCSSFDNMQVLIF